MEATHQAMMEIDSANAESSRCIERLASKSARVEEVLTVIQDVVQQTNLLALNAFIIASQAGEQGRAFTVVANEVKSLAQRTAVSATEIDGLLQAIQDETGKVQRSVTEGTLRVKQGVQVAAVAAEALARIEDSAAEASEMVRKIAVATEEQASATRLITAEAEKNLERVTQTTLAVREQERAAADIVRTLEQMKNLAGRIRESSQEQVRGNKLYLATVVDDSEKAKKLKGEFVQQLRAAEEVSSFLRETGSLIERNADGAQGIAARIEEISELTRRLKQELTPLLVTNTAPPEVAAPPASAC